MSLDRQDVKKFYPNVAVFVSEIVALERLEAKRVSNVFEFWAGQKMPSELEFQLFESILPMTRPKLLCV